MADNLTLRRSMALLVLALGACVPAGNATSVGTPVGSTSSTASPSATSAPTLIPTQTPSRTPHPTPGAAPTPAAVPAVESLKAMVIADLLSCRYGPGPNYLFLYGLRKGANIVLIGRTDGDNWHWVYVQGRSKCWVNTNYLEIQGSWQALPIVYPGIATLPISPYYPPTSVLSAVRKGDEVTVEWLDIPLRAGDEEDERMQHYLVEVWHCEHGTLVFEPLATNELSVSFTDQPGCSAPSHGRVFVQEKHGFAGPTEISWPPFQ